MAADSAKSGSAADSYIGSVISLTSKSEIRYEGVLYHINPEESSIGLQNVRSFGSEGRKKDGPQIPPIDRIYEYILFRGSDIKDLQVKSSPTAGTTSSIDNDPAIIQSHYSHPAAAPSTLPTIASLSSADSSSHVQQLGGDQVSRFQGGDVNSLAPQMGLPGSNFQGEVNSHSQQLGLPGSNFPGRIPLYQPGGSLGAWGASPPPNVSANSLAVPMYWTGVYGPPSGLPPLHQQSLLRPPSGLAMPPTLQPTMQYPGFNVPLAPGSASVPGSNLSGDDAMPSTLQPMVQYPGFNVPLAPGSASVPGSNLSTSIVSGSSTITTDSSQPPSVPPVSLVTSITSETPSSSVLTKGSSSVLPLMAVNTSLPLLSPPVVSNSEPSSIAQSALNQVAPISESKFSYQNISQATSSSITSTSNLNDAPKPLLVTPAQLLQPGKTQTSSSHAHRDVKVVRVSSVDEQTPSIPKEQTVQEKIVPAPKEAQPPILPLPAAPRAYQKPNGAPSQVQYGYRGRGRGRGNGRHPLTRFTEDFDFTAMNEKFNKDEVWGHLGKSGKSHSKDREGEGNASDGDGSEYGNAAELPNVDVKPVYNKDDFFDSLSVPDGDSQHGRLRFSEQRKIDAETFGDFGRYRGRGGRGIGFVNHGGRGIGFVNHGGRGGRGYNYRRGYGYGGTGRGSYGGGRGRGGNAVPSQAS